MTSAASSAQNHFDLQEPETPNALATGSALGDADSAQTDPEPSGVIEPSSIRVTALFKDLPVCIRNQLDELLFQLLSSQDQIQSILELPINQQSGVKD